MRRAATDNEKRWAVLEAAVEYADLEMLSMSVAAPAAGLDRARHGLLHAVRRLIGVESGRESEYGHISYRMLKYKEQPPTSTQEELERYKKALEEIASEDYRGNRPQSAVTAYYALHPEEKP